MGFFWVLGLDPNPKLTFFLVKLLILGGLFLSFMNYRGWLLGSIDGQTQGIMPANYLKIMGKKQGEADLSKPDA